MPTTRLNCTPESSRRPVAFGYPCLWLVLEGYRNRRVPSPRVPCASLGAAEGPRADPPYAVFLAAKGIAHAQIADTGKNGLPIGEHVAIQCEGAIGRRFRHAECLPGKPALPPHKWLGQKGVQLTAEQAGVWYSAVIAGDVEEGQ